MTTVAYIDRLGGTKSRTLVKISKELWAWCLKRGIALQAQHLPGKQNLSAYFMSRHLRDRTDWILNPALFRFINQLWGCDQILASIGQILQLVSGSRGRGNICLFLRLEEFASLCSSSLASGFGENTLSRGNPGTGYTMLANTGLVPSYITDANRPPTITSRSTQKPGGPALSQLRLSSSRQASSVGHMERLRKQIPSRSASRGSYQPHPRFMEGQDQFHIQLCMA